MKNRKTQNARRAGMTLIELLVVIAIIAVLASLISAAVFGAYNRAAVAQAQTEITDLNNAVASARAYFNNIDYLPSKLVLREDNQYVCIPGSANYNINAPTYNDELRTVNFLQTAFSRQVTSSPQDWNGNGKPDNGVAFTLLGPTAMVFLLGGIPANTGIGVTGFSTNRAVPAPLAGGGQRVGPFYQGFKTNRLVVDSTASPFLFYTDTYGKGSPYLYLSSFAAGNDYNTNPPDCPAGIPVQPYRDSSGQFIHGKGFQIICAGKDGLFGPGGNWNGYGTGLPGSDDQANFGNGTLSNAP